MLDLVFNSIKVTYSILIFHRTTGFYCLGNKDSVAAVFIVDVSCIS